MVLNLMPIDPPEPEPPHQKRPAFINTISTGNLISAAASIVAVLPILSLVYEIGSWSASIEARITNLQNSIASVAELEQQDQKELVELKGELQVMLHPPLPNIIRPQH